MMKQTIVEAPQKTNKHNFIKKRSHRIAWFLTLILTFSYILSSIVFAADTAAIGRRENVKVGFFAWDGYHVMDDDKVCSGYGYDVMKSTENYCNWKLDFVGYDKTWAEMLQMLDDGEIDILTSAQKTPEWEEKYLFSDKPIGNSATVLSVRKEEIQYVVGNKQTYDGMVIGCLDGSSRNDKFKAFAENNNFDFTFVVYENLEDLKAALENKDVDGVLSTNLRTFNGETVLETFDPVDYYAIVRKDHSKLMDEFNQAITMMNYNTPSWKEKLQDKYFTDKSEGELIFTRTELDYLDQLKKDGTVFTVVTNPDLAPYSYCDKDGKPIGIVPELFDEIAARIGLQYKYEYFKTYDEYNKFVSDGKADIDLTCVRDYGLAAHHGIIITNPYLDTSLALLSRGSFKEKYKVYGIVNGSTHNTSYSSEIFDDVETRTYATNKDMVKAISSGQVDAGYQYSYSAQKAVEEDTKHKLVYTILPQYDIEMCMGTNENYDYRLIAILNKGIHALSGLYTEHLIQDNIARISRPQTVISMIYDYPVLTFFMLLIFFLGVITAILAAIKTRSNKRQIAKDHEMINARTEFFQLISHEIRTPLNAVNSYIKMIPFECNIPQAAKEYLEKAQIATGQLIEISDNMQDYAKITSGDIELKNNIVKLKDLFLQVDQIIKIKADLKQQNYRFDVHDLTRQYVLGDRLRLALVYQNILENAVKFTPNEGTIQADVKEEVLGDKDVKLVFTCADTGKGMSKEFTDRINEAFHQDDPAYSRTHGGLGLGLFLTQFFVKKMGGSISLDSKEGEGTTLRIEIPCKCPSVEEMGKQGIKCRPVRTIVYETDDYAIQMAKKTFKEMGMKVEIYGDIKKVKKRIETREGGEYAYDVVILDVDLLENPDEEIEAIAKLPTDIEIIAITGDKNKMPAFIKSPLVSHTVYMEDSYFELFNALIADFGEFTEHEDVVSDVDLSHIHAMIVEDNNINATILKKILEKRNISAVVCENGKIAVDTFNSSEENTFQVIFMDIQMPVMDGLTATREIRKSANKQGSTIPILAVSANAFPEDVKKSIEAGIDIHLAKPVDAAVLYREIEKCCVA